MLTNLAIFVAVCCAFAHGASNDPYSRRFDVCKDSMDSLLDTPSGSTSCTLIQGLKALPTKAALTATQTTVYNTWIQNIEIDIVKNPSYSTKKMKFSKIAASFEQFNQEQSVIYGKIQWLNVTTWGPVDSIVRISNEWNFQSSLELVVATSSKGNCKLFDLLLSACSGDSEKHAALSAFIESDLKVIVKDKTKTQKEIIKAVFKAFKTKFFVGVKSGWMSFFNSLNLEGFFTFKQWTNVAVTYEREESSEVILTGDGMDCPFILALNTSLSSTSYTVTQKGFIKQLMNFFIQQWTTVKTPSDRMIIIQKKFSESIDLSWSWFSCLNSITITVEFGNFWDLIIIGCQKPRLPTTCGCPVPTFSDEVTTTTVAAEETTEPATTEMPTTEMTTEGSTEGSTEFTTEGSTSEATTAGTTWDSTFSSITFPSTTQGCSCSCEV